MLSSNVLFLPCLARLPHASGPYPAHHNRRKFQRQTSQVGMMQISTRFPTTSGAQLAAVTQHVGIYRKVASVQLAKRSEPFSQPLSAHLCFGGLCPPLLGLLCCILKALIQRPRSRGAARRCPYCKGGIRGTPRTAKASCRSGLASAAYAACVETSTMCMLYYIMARLRQTRPVGAGPRRGSRLVRSRQFACSVMQGTACDLLA